MLNLEQLFNMINEGSYYIYGAGGAAKRFFEGLCELGLTENCKGFIVSKKDMKKIKEEICLISDNVQVFIAVHKVYLHEIESLLEKNHFKKYYWIYPLIFELEYGSPVKKNVIRETDELVSRMRSLYMLAIFYLTIDYCLGKNTFGKDCHIRFHMKDVSGHSAKRIEELFEQRIKKYLKTGEVEPYPIMINVQEDYCMDGNHKLIISKYFHIPEVNCNIYHDNDLIKELRQNHNFVKTPREVWEEHDRTEAIAILNTMEILATKEQ